MFTVKILLNSIERVNDFINIVSGLDTNMDIICGENILNAKSIVGIFTLNLSQPVELRIRKDAEEAEEIITQLTDYLV